MVQSISILFYSLITELATAVKTQLTTYSEQQKIKTINLTQRLLCMTYSREQLECNCVKCLQFAIDCCSDRIDDARLISYYETVKFHGFGNYSFLRFT